MPGDREITAPLDLEALRVGWATKGEGQPRLHTRLALGARTDMGRVRENNEDKFDFIEPDEPAVLARKGRFYAVADGMGGHSAGQIASELALKTVIRAFYADGNPDLAASLKRAIVEANRYLIDIARTIPERSGMGTTLTGAVVREDELLVVQVGDSRCYLLRGNGMEQVTEDHSWVQEQVRRGTMTLEEAESSPFRNVITRSLGAAPEVEPELFAIKLQPDDRILLCSDGLTGMMSDTDLFDIARHGSASVAAWELVDRAVANGGKDNVTVLVLDVLTVEPWEGAKGRGGEGTRGRGDETQAEETAGMEIGSSPSQGTGSSAGSAVAPSPSRPLAPSPAAPEPRGVRAIMKGLLGK